MWHFLFSSLLKPLPSNIDFDKLSKGETEKQFHGERLGEYNEETATAADSNKMNISKTLNTLKMQLKLSILPYAKRRLIKPRSEWSQWWVLVQTWSSACIDRMIQTASQYLHIHLAKLISFLSGSVLFLQNKPFLLSGLISVSTTKFSVSINSFLPLLCGLSGKFF